MDTIFALASAPGRAGVSVIRISGPRAHDAASGLAGVGLPSRGMRVHLLKDAQGDILDEAVILTFSAPNSFTGEDVAELQVHGSIATVSAIMRALSGLDGLRMAEPGEFTRRALENGRMDLAQVEGLADLIDAETEGQRRQALALLGGRLGGLADGWRTRLIRAAALIEATLDFADEEVPEDVTPEVTGLLTEVADEVRKQADGVGMAERIRTGFEVAIVGAPNVGKSTLLNMLAGREAAITSEHAGTTRDVIEVRMDLEGLPVTLLDTAGLRETEDHVESIGIERARDRAVRADLRVFLAETDEELDVAAEPGDIRVRPKGDMRQDPAGSVSGRTGQGVDELVSRISQELSRRSAQAGTATRERHREALRKAADALQSALAALELGAGRYDIAAEDIRVAIRALESLVGRIDVETLLDEIFSSFCLGK